MKQFQNNAIYQTLFISNTTLRCVQIHKILSGCGQIYHGKNGQPFSKWELVVMDNWIDSLVTSETNNRWDKVIIDNFMTFILWGSDTCHYFG